MTPEDLKRAQAKLTRYGEKFDPLVDHYLPADLSKTQLTKVAKRQPKYKARTKAYYQAQCSFRGLKTSGKTEELQHLLKTRDISKDINIKNELDRVGRQVGEHDEEERKQHAESWWLNPATTLDEKVFADPFRALKENLEQGGSLKRSCHVFKRFCPGIKAASLHYSLAYESIENPPDQYRDPERSDRYMTFCQIVGQPAAVRAMAKKIEERAAQQRSGV